MTWSLVESLTREEMKFPEDRRSSQTGLYHTLIGGIEPKRMSDLGRVYDDNNLVFVPGVFGLRWVYTEDDQLKHTTL